jgi:hypothetical protein
MSIRQNPWPESLRARFREDGYAVDQPPEEFPTAHGTPRTWGYLHPATGAAVVFSEGRLDARVWRSDRVRAARTLRRPAAVAQIESGVPTEGAAATIETRYLDLLRRERTLTAELRLVKAEREQIEREIAQSMMAARMRETSIGPVQLAPRVHLAVRVSGERLRVEDLRDAGLQRWVRESVDYALLRRDIAHLIQVDRESGLTLDAARERFFDLHPPLAGKLVIEEEADLSVSGERKLYQRERLAWSDEEDAALVAEYQRGARLDVLVTRYQRPPSAIAGRLATLLWSADSVDGPGAGNPGSET